MADFVFTVNSEEEFKSKVVDSSDVVIVDFFATWCGPCRELTPRLTEVVESFQGKIKLAKVDVDDLQDLAMEYEVEALPTVVIIKGGKVTSKFMGLKDKGTIKDFIEKALA